MNFGYYDNDNREYVITRPDTPTPWLNYLGNGGFSGIISNTAGGLVFDRDPGNFRITRYNFNRIPYDRPGRYLYFKDMDSGAVWSPTWQPCKRSWTTTAAATEWATQEFPRKKTASKAISHTLFRRGSSTKSGREL